MRATADTGTTRFVAHPTPVGTLVLGGDDDHLTHVLLPGAAASVAHSGPSQEPGGAPPGVPAPVAAARRQLDEYFAGARRSFDLPLAAGGTEFQRRVWFALAEIPYGETISYAELAGWIGRPTAFRAVGQANGANPLPIVLPCHRVVASGGGIGGYGGGLDLKRRLLALEEAHRY